MNDDADLFEERLARLEAGDSLESCVEGLAEEEAQDLKMAAELMGVPFNQDEARVKALRGELLSMAAHELRGKEQQSSTAAAPANWRELLERLGAIFGQRRAVAALAIVLILVLFAGFWATRSGPPRDDSMIAAPERTPGQGGQPAAELASLPDGASTAATQADASSNIYIPAITSPLNQTPQQAVLEKIHGLVEVQDQDGNWYTTDNVALLQAGQRVRSGNLSSARLLFYDGSQARIGANSELAIDQLEALRPEQGFRTVVLSQLHGESGHQVQFRNDAGSRYEVKTAGGSGIARGTSFRVMVGQDAQASYLVTEGRVEVSSGSQTVLVAAGQMTSFVAEEPPARPAFLVDGEGIVTDIGETWTVDGQRFAVDDSTLILGDPQVGDLVHVEGRLRSGELPKADVIELLRDSPAHTFSLTGQVDEIGANSWIIAGQAITITSSTRIGAGIEEGDMVRVSGTVELTSGRLVAVVISLLEVERGMPFEFAGIVQSMGENTWRISGIEIAINDATEIEREIEIGDIVKVEGYIEAEQVWKATEVKLLRRGGTSFAFTGQLRSRDPWQVGEISFEVRNWTYIQAGVEVGDWVRVSGTILDDGTWVASSITRMEDEQLSLVFVGTVENIDPWVIAGLPISTDGRTKIDGSIIEGDLVRVTVWILGDGRWLASSIERLDQDDAEGCVALTAVINAVSGRQIQLNDGRSFSLGDDAIVTGELRVGSVVVIVACVDENGTIDVLSITVIYNPAEQPPPPPPGEDDRQRVTICHKPDSPAEKTMSLPQAALGGHLGHGDYLGACQGRP